jgi:hypothetical protein
MKRFILILSLLFSAVAINAQQQQTEQTPEQRAHIQAMRLQKLVSTNDEQTQKAEVIFLAKINAINAIMTDASKTPDQQKAAVDQVKAEKDKELSQILTAEQYTTYRAKMDEIAARKNLAH